MDEVFARFLEKNGPIMTRREVPPPSIERYKGKLPSLLLSYWKEHGWCGVGEGILWLVNPQEYEAVVASWIENTALEALDTFHLVARSAFGDLYLFGKKTGFSLSIDAPVSRYSISNQNISPPDTDREVQNFLLTFEKDYNDFDDLFDPSQKKLGTLRDDEMYGFVPALSFGGRADLQYIEKVKTVEHLTLLSQITELEPYTMSDPRKNRTFTAFSPPSC